MPSGIALELSHDRQICHIFVKFIKYKQGDKLGWRDLEQLSGTFNSI